MPKSTVGHYPELVPFTSSIQKFSLRLFLLINDIYHPFYVFELDAFKVRFSTKF
jgi:hypothetical protein